MTKSGKNRKKKNLKKKAALQRRALAAVGGVASATLSAAKKKRKFKEGTVNGVASPSSKTEAGATNGLTPPGNAKSASHRDDTTTANGGTPSVREESNEGAPAGSSKKRKREGGEAPNGVLSSSVAKVKLPRPRRKQLSAEEFERQKKLRKQLRLKEKKRKLAEAAALGPPQPKSKKKKKEKPPGLGPGDMFPDDLGEFNTDESMPDNPKTVNLSELLKSQGVVLFTFTRADASGCTKQALEFDKQRLAYEARGYALFGLSPSHPKATSYWKRKRGINLRLLSDPLRLRLKKLRVTMGNKGVIRSYFVIDRGGVIRDARMKVKPEQSARFAWQSVASKRLPPRVHEPLVPLP